ncbi:hypothetical protein BH10PSE14_BH10PSE14_41860 [soil metagenome]
MCSPQLKSPLAARERAQTLEPTGSSGNATATGPGDILRRRAMAVAPFAGFSQRSATMSPSRGISPLGPTTSPTSVALPSSNFAADVGEGSGSPQGSPATEDELSRAQSIYGETASLYPQLKSPTGNIYDRATWQDTSWSALWDARALIGVISRRNSSTRRDDQSKNTNPLVQRQWNQAVWPAQSSSNLRVPANVQFFYLRDANVAPRPSASFPGKLYVRTSVYKSYGPFVNNGGGSFGHSNKVYIDFYQNDGPAKGPQ